MAWILSTRPLKKNTGMTYYSLLLKAHTLSFFGFSVTAEKAVVCDQRCLFWVLLQGTKSLTCTKLLVGREDEQQTMEGRRLACGRL